MKKVAGIAFWAFCVILLSSGLSGSALACGHGEGDAIPCEGQKYLVLYLRGTDAGTVRVQWFDTLEKIEDYANENSETIEIVRVVNATNVVAPVRVVRNAATVRWEIPGADRDNNRAVGK